MSVPFVDLGRMHGPLRPELSACFDSVTERGAFTLGAELEGFEDEFAAYCGSAHCVGLSDGTEALRLGLLALGAGPGSEVATVPSTFIATLEAIAATGARPVLVDIDPQTRCMDPDALGDAIGPRTAAVVPVHLYGRLAPVEALREAAGDVPVLEDAAQAHGARASGGGRAGSLGTAGAFSFYPTKNLGAFGDGGALVTDDAELAEVARSLRHHGAVEGDANNHGRRGATSRLDNLQAAFLSIKLPHLDAWNDERRRAAGWYRELLADLPVGLPPVDQEGETQVFHLFAVELDDRDRVKARLADAGIRTAIHYPRPAHLNAAWAELGEPGSYPAAEALAQRTLSLPMFPGIEEREVEQVATALRAALA